MTTGKLQAGAAGVLLLAVAAGLVLQHRANAELGEKLDNLREQRRAIMRLQGENDRLAGGAAEVAALRQDDVAFVQLQGEAAALQKRRTEEARAEATARWQAARAKLAGLLTRYNNGHPSVVAQRAEVAALAAGLGIPDDGMTVFDASQLDQPPAPKTTVRPAYPFEQRRAGIPGEVLVSFIIGTNGEVVDARAAKSTQPEFEGPAVEAIKRWKFSPGQRAGLPVNVRIQMPIIFSPGDTSGMPGWF